MKLPVQFLGDRLSVHFDRFDADAYRDFLAIKALPECDVTFHNETETYTLTAPKRFAAMLGVSTPGSSSTSLPLLADLFDDQEAICRIALDAKRFAVWSDCGLGKTLIQLEFARQVIHRTAGRFLIVTMNDIVDQFIDECHRFYGESLPIHRIRNRDELRRWCAASGPGLAITNYEKFNPEDGQPENQVISELRQLAGISLDESSRLKTGGGKQKWAIIKSSKGIEYKLSATATPAPNDTMEFASQAAFLERMRSENDIIWTYFHRDKQSHRWTVKRHCREAFFQFMASWSIYVRDPRKYGWRLDHEPVPEPIVQTIEIPATVEQLEEMRRIQTDAGGQLLMFEKDNTNAIERVKLSEIAKGFLYVEEHGKRRARRIPSRKPEQVIDLIAAERDRGANVLVWTQFDEETDILAERLRGYGVMFDVLTGRVPKPERAEILSRFRRGESHLLIGRAKMIGYGQNFQACSAMIFSGWNDSYEEFYQAIRRAVRHGQSERVRVYLPVIRELEGDMLENIRGKEAKHLAAIEDMERNYVRSLQAMRLVG